MSEDDETGGVPLYLLAGLLSIPLFLGAFVGFQALFSAYGWDPALAVLPTGILILVWGPVMLVGLALFSESSVIAAAARRALVYGTGAAFIAFGWYKLYLVLIEFSQVAVAFPLAVLGVAATMGLACEAVLRWGAPLRGRLEEIPFRDLLPFEVPARLLFVVYSVNVAAGWGAVYVLLSLVTLEEYGPSHAGLLLVSAFRGLLVVATAVFTGVSAGIVSLLPHRRDGSAEPPKSV